MLFGGSSLFKCELRHRGMRVGILLPTRDIWVQAPPAGGGEESRTPVRKHLNATFYGCITPSNLLLGYPTRGIFRRATFYAWSVQRSLPTHVHRYMTLRAKPRYSMPERATPQGDGTAQSENRLSSHCKLIVVVCFFSLGSYRDYPARPAYHASTSPSKPLRPHI